MVSLLLLKGSFRISVFFLSSFNQQIQVLGPSNMSYLRASLQLQHVLSPLPFFFFFFQTVHHLNTCVPLLLSISYFLQSSPLTPEHFRSGVSVSALSGPLPISTGCNHLLTPSNLESHSLYPHRFDSVTTYARHWLSPFRPARLSIFHQRELPCRNCPRFVRLHGRALRYDHHGASLSDNITWPCLGHVAHWHPIAVRLDTAPSGILPSPENLVASPFGCRSCGL